MLPPHLLRRVAFTLFLGLALILGDRAPALAQQAPWTGVVADEARPHAANVDAPLALAPHAISGDGRYVVFHSERTLLPDDTNGVDDVFLRDRFSGGLTRVSVSSGGNEGNGPSSYPSISRDGRHIIFSSCATNLVANDTNFACDVFVHDRAQGTTVRVNLGVSGEEATSGTNWLFYSITGNGRYVAFVGWFDESGGTYLRDRDGDADGVFDEPEDSTTVRISPTMVNGERPWGFFETPAISNDGRWIAYAAGTMDANWNWLGLRMFVTDRSTSTTSRIDRPPFMADAMYSSSSPDFSDTNELVFYTSVPYLVPEDTDNAYDVYVFNLLTGGHTHITQTHNAENPYHRWEHEQYPAITPDGRYVAFAGNGTQDHRDVYLVDRTTGTSSTLNLTADGLVDANGFQPSYGMVSISADGSAVVFEGTAAILAGGLGHSGVFVATSVAVTPDIIDAAPEFGSYTLDVNVPAGVAWTLNWSPVSGLDTVTPDSGVGPATVEVTVSENTSGNDREHVITLGSEKVVIRQELALEIHWNSPYTGPTAGGTEVSIYGHGIKDGATVTFGDVPATSVTWISSEEIMAVTPPRATSEWVNTKVTNPNGSSSELYYLFFYEDVTPPEITSTITGTLGANGWYTSDVLVEWTVVDHESEVGLQVCHAFSQNVDTTLAQAACYAESGGGGTDQLISIKRDTVAPMIGISSPSAESYLPGQTVELSFGCYDETSEVATCTANQSGTLNTSSTGTFTFTVTAVDHAGHTSTNSVTYTVERITPVITWPTPAPIVEGTLISEAQLNATASVQGSFEYAPPYGIGVMPGPGTHTLTVLFTPLDLQTYTTATATVTLNVQILPAITWANPAAIVIGDALTTTQLNATANVPGTFAFSPAAGAVLPQGWNNLSVTFTPTDGTTYAPATKTVMVLVKAVPVVTWANPVPQTFPHGLNGLQLNATASVPGTFVYSPPFGTTLNAGVHTLSVTFTPTSLLYTTATATATFQVVKGSTTVDWPYFDNITYGTALSSAQLHAHHNALDYGGIVYAPPAGTVLNAGTHTLSATFVPQNPNNYDPVTVTRPITVFQAYPPLTWSNPAPIPYGTALSAAQLNASSTVPGTFSYNPPLGTVLDAGSRTLTATFTPDSPNYQVYTAQKTLTVTPLTTSLTWSNPAAIVYGTPLGATQLNASANVPGTFSYTPALGTVLDAGNRSLYVSFTPADAVNYTTASQYVSIVVQKATPIITWSNPAPIAYGTALGWTQYNATISGGCSGHFDFSPSHGTVLEPGPGQALTATWEPNAPQNYHSASSTVTIDVVLATPVVTWANPATIVYGTALSGTQLNASSPVAGTFAYAQPAGTVLPAGSHTLSVTFTPADPGHYATVTATATITVSKATPVITWPTPSAITYGTALGGAQLNATTGAAGDLAYSPGAGTVLDAGTHTLTVTFTPSDATNYNGASTNVTIVVDQATPTIEWPSPANITYGTRLSSVQLNATHNGGNGYLRYLPTDGTLLNAGTHTLSVTYVPLPPHNYASAEAQQTITVLKANPIIAWSMSPIVYGTALSGSQLNGQANVAGTFTYDLPAAGTVLDAGSYTFTATFTPTNQSNYHIVSVQRTLVVHPQTVIPTWPTPAPIVYGTPLGATQLNATPNVPGTISYSPAAGTVLAAGSHSLLATFTPESANYASLTIQKTITVVKATPAITWSNPAGITYGTALSATQLNATAGVPGSFAYAPDAGVVLGAGAQTLSVVFTPTDAANYQTASTTRPIAVAQKGLTISTDNTTKVYGQALPVFTVSGTGFVNGDAMASLSGTPSFATSATATSAPGTYNVTPSGVSSANYTITFAAGSLTISKANTTLTLQSNPSPSNHNQTVTLTATVAPVAPGAGTPTGSVQFRDNGVLIGTASLVNGVATMTKSLKRGSHPLTATYAATTNFNGSTGAKTHQVN
jgi:hypothetical protein